MIYGFEPPCLSYLLFARLEVSSPVILMVSLVSTHGALPVSLKLGAALSYQNIHILGPHELAGF
jgi:hypothetical protein